MRLYKSLLLALNMLTNSKLRSWLTIIGIVIGIAAVISILSISGGAQRSMEDRFASFEADIITINPGFSRATGFRGPPHPGESGSSGADQDPLTNKDVLALKNIPNIKYIMGMVTGKAEIKYLGSSGDASIKGVDTSVWKDLTTDELETGRFLMKGDKYAVVLGYKRANSFFDKPVQVNRQILIEGKIFKVVGIFKEGEDDNSFIIPLETARDILEDIDTKELSSITVKVGDMEKIDGTIEDIEKKLMLTRGILQETKKDFTVSSMTSMRQNISETLNTMAIFLGAIAAISLVVGAVGICNTMFTSVLEKTKEIGIMKAIGAKNRDIMMIFLLNAGMIGLVGGIGGVILGSVASGSVGALVSGEGGMMRMFSSTSLSIELLLAAFLFSILIGIIAGAIPAYRASRLKPVDALRYE
ncbi:ABC transporter permease [Candidatus Woesearchaeota archaeon]|nr:ABC transporter permease [Candidatus Woesearchaeota archaeon]